MSQENQQGAQIKAKEDEISLKELILKMGNLIRYLISNWKIIVCFSILFAALGLVYSLLKKPIYTGEITFVMEEESNSGSLGAYAGIASQFGINLGNTGGGLFQGDNIIEFIKSRAMIRQALLSKANIGGKEDLLVNHYINFNHLKEKWQNDPKLTSITFQDSIGNQRQDSLMNEFYETIIKNNLTVEKPDKKLTIISVKVRSPDELFSKLFVEKLMDVVTGFYTKTRTKKSQQNLAILTHQVDSVRRELNAAISGVASASEGAPNANVAFQRLKVPSQTRSVDVQANTAILTELVKNQELAKVTYRNDVPLIQVLDRPILPLDTEKLGKIKGVVVGGFLGGILICFFLIGRLVLNNIMG